MRCRGMHCPGCGNGGRAAALLVVVIIIGVALARPVAHAAEDAIRVAVEVLKVAAIVVASAAGLAVLGGITVLAARLRRRLRAGGRQAVVIRQPAAQQTIAGAARQLPAAPEPELPGPQARLHLHGATADDVTEIITRHGEEG